VTAVVAVEELIRLYAGESDEQGELTMGCATVPLALEICRCAKPSSLSVALQIVFGSDPLDEVPWRAAHTLSIGFARYEKQLREQELAGRGL
jgi:hypothetical protein